MKIQYVSDLHLEFAPITINNNIGADVLVLAGDIFPYVMADKERITEFFTNVSRQFRHIIYIAGNHEFYRGRWTAAHTHLYAFAARYGVHYLNKEPVCLDGTWFFGGTLWTDCANENPISMSIVQGLMNDYRLIQNVEDGYYSLSVETTIAEHKDTKARLGLFLSQHDKEKVVVVTHHCPSFKSVNPYHAGSEVNSAYYSNLESLIMDHPNIQYWIHGHMHGTVNYKIGETTVIENARGYVFGGNGTPENVDFNPDCSVDLP